MQCYVDVDEADCNSWADYTWCGMTPAPTVTPQPTVDVCGAASCDYCLKLSNSHCKTGKSHDTQSECEAQGANYEWCGDPEPSEFYCLEGDGGPCYPASTSCFPNCPNMGNWNEGNGYSNTYESFQAYCSTWSANNGNFYGGVGSCPGTPGPTVAPPTFDAAAVTCENYDDTDNTLVEVYTFTGDDIGNPYDISIPSGSSKIGIQVNCIGTDACKGNSKLRMDSGKVVPVAVVCCGTDACSGNFKLEVKDWATGVNAYGYCDGNAACSGSSSKWKVWEGHTLHMVCESGTDVCKDTKLEVKGNGGTATCSGNGCSDVGSRTRRLAAANNEAVPVRPPRRRR